MKAYIALSGLLASSLVGPNVHAAEREGAAKDAWIDGTLEAVYALSRHLSNFVISTEVHGGISHLTGNVSHDFDRDLAGKLASVKWRLIANAHTSGLPIDVDTRNDQVTPSGEVASGEDKSLAEEFAASTGDVKSVRKRLIGRVAR